MYKRLENEHNYIEGEWNVEEIPEQIKKVSIFNRRNNNKYKDLQLPQVLLDLKTMLYLDKPEDYKQLGETFKNLLSFIKEKRNEFKNLREFEFNSSLLNFKYKK